MTETCLTFNNLTLGYGSHAAIHHLNGALRKGSLTAVVGANGSGKSTLLKGIVGMLKPMSGSIAARPGTRIAYLPQQSEIDRSFPARVADLIALGLWPKRGLFGRYTSEDRAHLSAALLAVGLEGFENRALDTLSGGQMQRSLFARVLLQNADLILLDEPFNAIDAKTVRDLLDIIRRWHGEGRTVMVVAHDLEMVRENFPEALLLARQAVAWGPARDALLPERMLAARHFEEAWQEDAPWCGDETAQSSPSGAHHDHKHDHTHHEHV
ncbi:MAG: metal ABC transporter ATP-binding protein [Rhizobiaceae bacterium]|nr:metal ABC transporter ATP-binding protein [Rhizobiaceae bacterium]